MPFSKHRKAFCACCQRDKNHSIFDRLSGKSGIYLFSHSIKIIFKDDGGQPSTKGEDENEKTMKITFFNFHNALGQGNTEAAEIGHINGKKLFLTFRIFALNEKKLRTFEYTFYLKNE